MQMFSVASSSISSIGYDEDTYTLRIIFHDSGVYDYQSVPPIIVQQFLNASSKGKYYAAHIKGRFNRVRIQ